MLLSIHVNELCIELHVKKTNVRTCTWVNLGE